MTSPCPFFSGNAVSAADFLDRRQAVRRTVGRLLRGESTAIVGEPRCGKTSLLLYLAAPEMRPDLYGDASARLLFKFLNTQVLGSGFTQAQFWAEALAPVKEELVDPEPGGSLAKQYRVCQDNGFGSFTLEVLFRRLGEQGRQLVLLLDEFDLLLHHPILNCGEFFGSLRSLASTSKGALALVIASRLPLARLNAETQAFNPTSSPYFNIFNEIVLGDFPSDDVEVLLARAGERFTALDRRNIRRLAGGHPFLLQAAAEAMWDAYDEGLAEAAERHRYVGQRLYQEQRQHFADIWRNWTSETRLAFAVVALANAEALLPERKFSLEALLDDLPNYAPELGDLEHAGLLKRHKIIRGGWLVTQEVMTWWLSDELIRAMRDESALGLFLRSSEWEGRLTHSQREQLKETAHSFGHGVSQVSVQRDQTTQNSSRINLRQGLVDCFSEEELHTLCFDMGLDYESLPAQGKSGKAREIVAHFERIDRVSSLVERCRRLRPNEQWDEMPKRSLSQFIERFAMGLGAGLGSGAA